MLTDAQFVNISNDKIVSTDAAKLSKKIRDHTKWSQAVLADRLLVSRNYISLVEGGKNQASVRLLQSLQRLAHEVGLVSTQNAQSVSTPPPLTVHDVQAPYGAIADIEREIEQSFENLMAAARGDPARLGWILEQQRAHLTIPPHWRTHEEVNARAVAMNLGMREKLKRHRASLDDDTRSAREA